MNNQSMKKKCKKLLAGIVNAISILVIVAAIWILLSVVMTKPGQTPNILGFSMFRVMTGSMEPEIRTDALIVVKKQDPGTLAIGDVISFYSHDPALYGMVNTHRIVEIEEENGSRTFYTKGDANRIADNCLLNLMFNLLKSLTRRHLNIIGALLLKFLGLQFCILKNLSSLLISSLNNLCSLSLGICLKLLSILLALRETFIV